MSVGLTVFEALCVCGDQLAALRDRLCPGSDAWVALCELVWVVDACIDRLVDSTPLEEDEDAA